MPDTYHWWQCATIYQCYIRSFKDSNGDGIGDLPGLIEQLDYLQWLGVDAIWISPFYPSPMADMGFDITDHTDIDPRFGTFADFDHLITAAHRQNLKVLIDFIPNHTSIMHPWFHAARSSRTDPRHDWYIWHDPATDGGPPTNWRSVFGGTSAWTHDPQTGQYYYHTYLPEQPDLNLRNPAVQNALLNVLRFWLDRGVDGFRVDALRQLIKDNQWRDNPLNPAYEPGSHSRYNALLPVHTTNQPDVYTFVSKMRQVVDTYAERVLIGELYLPIDRLITYYGKNGSGVHLPTNFHLMFCPWYARPIADLIQEYESMLPEQAWPNWIVGNHDQPRVASRVGAEQVRVAAMLLFTLRGTIGMYYGDEIGMQDAPIPPEQVQDPQGQLEPGRGRDSARTPMQWNRSPGAGFTSSVPWLPIPASASNINVAGERDDPGSLLTLYRRLIALRRANLVLTVGDYRALTVQDNLLSFIREYNGQRLQVALNLGNDATTLEPVDRNLRGHLVLSTMLDRKGETVATSLRLRPHEGVIVAW